METRKNNSRRDVVITDVDALVPKDHLLRKMVCCSPASATTTDVPAKTLLY